MKETTYTFRKALKSTSSIVKRTKTKDPTPRDMLDHWSPISTETLSVGGVYLYPPTLSYPNGKLRLLYECNPIAFLAEQAGGAATDGKNRILDIPPKELHQRCPLYCGDRSMVGDIDRFLKSN